MDPGKGKMSSNSIKEVPGRSKLRVESSNPIPTWHPIPKTSKLKLISPEEAIKLSSGSAGSSGTEKPRSKRTRVTSQAPRTVQTLLPSQAPRPVQSRLASEASRLEPTSATFQPSRTVQTLLPSQAPRPVQSRLTSEASRPEPTSATFQAPRTVQTLLPHQAPRPVQSRLTSEAPRSEPTSATFQAPRSVQTLLPSQAPRPVQSFLTSEAPRPEPTSATFKVPKPVPAPLTSSVRNETLDGLQALSMNTTTVKKRTTPSLFQPKLVPSYLQIGSKAKQEATNASTQVVEETVMEVEDRAKDDGSKELCQSIPHESLSELLLYRPALEPIWKGHIVDSALMPGFDCEFWAKPVSKIRRKALKLSKLMPKVLKVELVLIGDILNDVINRSPRLSDVEIYLFPDENNTEKPKQEYDKLLEVMSTRNAMIKANIEDTKLLIFSSKLLDNISLYFIKTQKKTENFLWGCFLQPKNSQPLVPKTDKDLDNGKAVDMEIDIENPTPSLDLKLTAETLSTPSISLVMVKKEVSVPPGFENQSMLVVKVKEEVGVPPGFEEIYGTSKF